MPVQIQLRRDTGANWSASNPVLAAGEIGVELDTRRFKIGNGTSAWLALDYAREETFTTEEKQKLASIQSAATTAGAIGDAHAPRTDNPHGTTAAQVGLDRVTNDAQLRAALDYAQVTPEAADRLLIRDATDGAPKLVAWSDLPTSNNWTREPRIVLTHYHTYKCTYALDSDPGITTKRREFASLLKLGVDCVAYNAPLQTDHWNLSTNNAGFLYDMEQYFGPNNNALKYALSLPTTAAAELNNNPSKLVELIAAKGNHPRWMKINGRPVVTMFVSQTSALPGSQNRGPAWWHTNVIAPLASMNPPVYISILPDVSWTNEQGTVKVFPAVNAAGTWQKFVDAAQTWAATTNAPAGFTFAARAWGSYPGFPSYASMWADAQAAAGMLRMVTITPGFCSVNKDTRSFHDYQGSIGLFSQFETCIRSNINIAYLNTYNDISESYLTPASQWDKTYVLEEGGFPLTYPYAVAPARGRFTAAKFCIKYFKSGKMPRVTADTIIFEYRRTPKEAYRNLSGTNAYPHNGNAPEAKDRVDILPSIQDAIYITVGAVSTATLRVTLGGGLNIDTNVGAGITHVEIPLDPANPQHYSAAGITPVFSLRRNGAQVGIAANGVRVRTPDGTGWVTMTLISNLDLGDARPMSGAVWPGLGVTTDDYDPFAPDPVWFVSE
jgi:hypothetical protein